jgi:hypothetical protein
MDTRAPLPSSLPQAAPLSPLVKTQARTGLAAAAPRRVGSGSWHSGQTGRGAYLRPATFDNGAHSGHCSACDGESSAGRILV